MADLKVILPAPCSEPWEGMSPQGCNRHCAACDKTIHDLSVLTVDQAEALLSTAEEVCVRAKVGPGGVVTLASGRERSRRRLIAAVGASVTLAVAACQTVPAEDRPDRYEISGVLPVSLFSSNATLLSSDGQSWDVKVERGTNRFRAINLHPGVYSFSYGGDCGSERMFVENIIVRESSVDLGVLEGGDICIVVGVMVRENPAGRG